MSVVAVSFAANDVVDRYKLNVVGLGESNLFLLVLEIMDEGFQLTFLAVPVALGLDAVHGLFQLQGIDGLEEIVHRGKFDSTNGVLIKGRDKNDVEINFWEALQ